MTFDFTAVFEAVLALATVVLTTLVIPWIKSKTTAQQQAQLMGLARIAVSAAEQIGGSGAEKKVRVVKFLREHGVQVDEAKLDAMIESAVYDMRCGILNFDDGIDVTSDT